MSKPAAGIMSEKQNALVRWVLINPNYPGRRRRWSANVITKKEASINKRKRKIAP